MGQDAGSGNTTGFSNSFFGRSAGLSNTTGFSNSFFGLESGRMNTTGRFNTFIGIAAGRNHTTGDRNTYVGRRAGANNPSGSGNVFIGDLAGQNATGSNQLYIANSETESPLIYGEFDNQIVNINGSLGVGIQNPERPIHLRATNAIFRIDRDRDDPGFAIVRYDQNFQNVWKSFYFYTRGQGPNNGKFVIADWGTNVAGPSSARLVIANNGNIGIGDFLINNPSQKLTVQGNALVNGTFINSDKRFKRNIRTLPETLSSLAQLRGVRYEFEKEKFADRQFSEGSAIGLIAQEVEKVFPELVVEDAQGYKAVNYDGLIPVLIEALKAQRQEYQSEIEALKTEVASLKAASATENGENLTQDLRPAQLYQNQPNPFDQNTQIKMFLPENIQNATLYIYNMQGQTLREIQISERGDAQVAIAGNSLASGMYLYALIADNQEIDVKRMILR